MGVHEAGQQRAAAQVDADGAASGEGEHGRVVADGQDAVAAHGQCLRAGECRIDGEDLTVVKDEVSGARRCSSDWHRERAAYNLSNVTGGGACRGSVARVGGPASHYSTGFGAIGWSWG